MRANGVPMKGVVRRALAVLVLGLVAAPLLWGTGACQKDEGIMVTAPIANDLMDLPILMEFIRADSALWVTLKADCSVVIASPQIVTGASQSGIGTARFMKGTLMIEKPGKIRLEAEQGRYQISVVGDGSIYRANLPAFNDSYQGRYGDPLPLQARRILMLADDLVTAWDWSNLFANRVPVLKNLGAGAEVLSLEMIEEPTPTVRLASSVGFDRSARQITSLQTFNRAGTVRMQIVIRAFDAVAGPEGKPVKVPRTVSLIYPATGTTIQIELRHIELNTQIPADTFNVQK